MNKDRYLYFLVFGFGLIASAANASLKFDGSSTASRLLTAITKTSGSASQEMELTANKAHELKELGSKIKAKYEALKALAEDVQETIDAAKDAYNDTMNNVNEIKSKYEETLDNLKSSELGTTANLTAELNSLKKKREDRQKNLTEELQAKAKAAEENHNTLLDIYDQIEDEEMRQVLAPEIEEAESLYASFAANVEKLNKNPEIYFQADPEYKSLSDQMKQVENRLKETGKEAGALTASYVKSFLKKSDGQKKQEYSKVIEENFLLPDEADDAKGLDRVLKHRNQTLIKDATHSFYVAAKLKTELDHDLEQAEMKKDNTAAVDYKLTAGNLLVEQRIDAIKTLYNYTNLLLAEMRLKTSQNMVQQDFRLKNYDKDPAVLNLDDYIFTEKDVPTDAGKKSFLDSVTQ